MTRIHYAYYYENGSGCVRCKKRDREGSFNLCGECYDLSIQDAKLRNKRESIRLAKGKFLDYPDWPRYRLGDGVWDNAVKAIEGR